MSTDDDLMAAVREGEQKAFEVLFERYRELVWRFFRRRVPDWHRAEELTQETFLVVLQSAARYEPRASFRSYLFGIAFKLLAVARRKTRDDGELREEALPGGRRPDPVVLIWVRQALADLDDDNREILLLREYEQLSYDEIAAVTSVPVGTVRSRLFRARQALRAKLEGQPLIHGAEQ